MENAEAAMRIQGQKKKKNCQCIHIIGGLCALE